VTVSPVFPKLYNKKTHSPIIGNVLIIHYITAVIDCDEPKNNAGHICHNQIQSRFGLTQPYATHNAALIAAQKG